MVPVAADYTRVRILLASTVKRSVVANVAAIDFFGTIGRVSPP
jgi:hypothetical protein